MKQQWRIWFFPKNSAAFVTLSACVATGIGCATLLGWALDVPVLMGVGPEWHSMRIITAVCFIMSASAILFLQRGSAPRSNFVPVLLLGSMTAVTGLLTVAAYLVELLTGAPLPITPIPLVGAVITEPARMAFITGVNFSLIGPALVLLGAGGRRSTGAGHMVLLPACVLTYLVFAGYVLAVHDLYDWLGVEVAFNAGIAFIFMCAALLIIRTDTWLMRYYTGDDAGGFMARRLLPALLALPLVIGFFRIYGERVGYFTSEVGVALVAISYTVCFVFLVWLIARSLQRTDLAYRTAEENLCKSEKQYRLIVENAAEGIWIVDREHVTTYVNNVMADLLGYTAREMLGVVPDVFVHADDIFLLRADRERRRTGATQINDFRLRRRDGSILWVISHASPIIGADGDYQGALAMITNISDRKDAEERIRRQNAQLNGINRVLEEALTSVTEEHLGTICLAVAEELTRSGCGFICELNKQGRLDAIALSDPGWEACRMTNPAGNGTMTDEFRVHGIYDRVISDGRGFFTNEPHAHPDSNGVPEGLSPLTAFLGAPLVKGGVIIGMIGLANRAGGYSAEDLDALESLGRVIVQAFETFRARRDLSQSEERFRLLFQQAAVGIKRLDTQGGFLEVNDKFCAILGYTRNDLLGLSVRDITHPEDYPIEQGEIARLLSREISSYSIEKRCLHKNGNIIWVRVTSSRTSVGAEPVEWWISVLEDITERKLAEEETRRVTGELMRSNRDLEQFAYVASHDLQEPLRAIAGFLGMLRMRYGKDEDGEAREFIDHSIQGAERMQALINDLLTFSRVGSRKGNFTAVSMKDAVGIALENLRVPLIESGAAVTIGHMPTVTAIASQMVQVFQNLIFNAVKFTGTDHPRIYIGARREDRQWVFSVSDNGIGIEEQYFERIFLIFQRLHSRSEYGGTGIGLAICKKIIELHNGSIWVESKPGEGSTFYFTLPD